MMGPHPGGRVSGEHMARPPIGAGPIVPGRAGDDHGPRDPHGAA